jgi:hypothetical protein
MPIQKCVNGLMADEFWSTGAVSLCRQTIFIGDVPLRTSRSRFRWVLLFGVEDCSKDCLQGRLYIKFPKYFDI